MKPRRADMVVNRWGARFRGRHLPVSIGRAGMTNHKIEGDMATPRGIWKITSGKYRIDRVPRPMILPTMIPLTPIRINDIWSDDPSDPNYNQPASSYNYPYQHEKLRMAPRLYDVVLMTDWNWPQARAGEGSAIFIHQWRRRRYPTAGCLAFSAKDLRWALERWSAHSRIFVI